MPLAGFGPLPDQNRRWPDPRRRGRHALASLFVVTATTLWEAALAASNMRWYAGLVKPTFAPSPWVAAAVSAALAALLALAFFRVLCRPDYLPDRPGAIRLFLVALGLDAAWAWLFFAGRHPSLALAVAAALAITAAAATWRFVVVDLRAGLMLLPWTFATAFVFLLDLSIALRNG